MNNSKNIVTIKIKKADRCNEEYGLFVSFPYDLEIINGIRELPFRYWNADTKEWEIPTNKMDYLLKLFKNNQVHIIDADNILFGNAEKTSKKEINYNFKTKPFEHQIVGFNYGMEHDKWLLGDEQGLGKTKTVIDIALAKREERGYKHCLIICGVNGLKWNWVNEIETHSNEQGYILGQKVKGDKVTIGSVKERLDDLNNIENIDNYFIITNVETLRDNDVCQKVKDLCNKGIINMIAIDEMHKVKNPTSLQGKAILKLKAETMIAMTGTPLMNSPLDLYIILKWLGYEGHSFYAFKQHHCEMGGYGGYQIVGYRNLNELQSKLNEIMLRRLKDEVLDLPEKTYIDEYVEMGTEQSKIYREVTSEIKANIDKIKMSNNPLSEMIRMRQATGYPGILSSEITDSAKLDRMEELVEDAIANNKKVLIFSNWTQITNEVYRRLSKNYRCLQITGETKDNERQDLVKTFQENDNYKIMIGSTGAMGTGLTLHAASIEIFLDEPWNRALKSQAEDRAHRIGQTKNLTIYSLLTKGTIDEKIHQLIYKKGKMSDEIVDRITTDKGALVDYLLS